MAHLPPPLGINTPAPRELWPWLFSEFDVSWPAQTYRYSMDVDGTLPMSPAYFNLGFVAMNAKALPVFAAEITDTTRRVIEVVDTSMRCQIALTIIAHRAGIDIGTLPASYNAANDLAHLAAGCLTVDQVRVLHFLRLDEIDREELQPHLIGDMSVPHSHESSQCRPAESRTRISRELEMNRGGAPRDSIVSSYHAMFWKVSDSRDWARMS